MASNSSRTASARRTDALERLRAGGNLWLATASDGHGPHLIPVSYCWDGARLLVATYDGSRTLLNLTAQPKVRASIGATNDVVMIDATATPVTADDVADEDAEAHATASGIPRGTPGFVYVRLVPERVQVWKGPAEFDGRTVMRGGRWTDAAT